MEEQLRETLSSDVIRYSQVWEDYRILQKALEVKPADTILSIASAGCNVLALLSQEPKKILALDISTAQLALTELKLMGCKHLNYADFLSLMGFSPFRAETYQAITEHLSQTTQEYWTRNQALLDEGLIHVGRLDRFFMTWTHKYVQKYFTEADLTALFSQQEKIPEAIEACLKDEDFKHAFTDYFSEENIAAKGRDPRQFKFVESDTLAEDLYQRFCTLIKRRDHNSNHYLCYLLHGSYSSDALMPFYAQEKNFLKLKPLIDRIELVCSSMEDFLLTADDGSIDKVNFSNIFEYMSDEQTDELLTQLASKVSKDGRIAYWNLFCPRRSSKNIANLWRHEDKLSDDLYAADRNWFYSAFHVETRCS